MKEMKMFCMRREHREWLIERHKFYVDQSISRVIRQFDDIENEALGFMEGEGWLRAIVKVPFVEDRSDYFMSLQMEVMNEGRAQHTSEGDENSGHIEYSGWHVSRVG